jgi:hypothetical protein
VKRYEPGMTVPVLRRLRTSQSGSGELAVTVPQSGFHAIVINGWSEGNGYEIAHKVSWRIRY